MPGILKKHACRARVFDLVQQESQAANANARIQQLAAKQCSAREMEQFKALAARSLNADHPNLPAKSQS